MIRDKTPNGVFSFYMKAIILSLLLASCAGQVNHCPVNSAKVALDCRESVKQGTMTKEQCYQLIEESCP